MQTSLLCTFTGKDDLDNIIDRIQDTYRIVFNYMYILQNKENLNELFVTYNIDNEYNPQIPLGNTILVHRKKEYNTLYTINALNEIVREENNGMLDRNYVINWNDLKNSIVTTDIAGIKKIPTRIYEVLTLRYENN